jgi:uncharacterized RDD family membrane protein YckC
LYCGKCGAQLAGDAEKCPNCGEPAAPASAPSGFVVKPRPAVKFAGFWLRFVALLIDSVILGILTIPILVTPIANNLGTDFSFDNYLKFMTGWSRPAIALKLLMNLIILLYCAAFESSAWQASPGKKVLGLYVTDLDGKRISLIRAAARNLGKELEQFTLFFGFVMAGITQKKQALHDIVAGCLVLKKP